MLSRSSLDSTIFPYVDLQGAMHFSLTMQSLLPSGWEAFLDS